MNDDLLPMNFTAAEGVLRMQLDWRGPNGKPQGVLTFASLVARAAARLQGRQVGGGARRVVGDDIAA